jgi:hypothetical protein
MSQLTACVRLEPRITSLDVPMCQCPCVNRELITQTENYIAR